MPPASLRLVSWNLGRLHFGRRVNRWLGLDSRASDGDLAHVARVIAGASADVVAVQELKTEAQLERLRGLLGKGWRAAAPSEDTCDRRVGVLARDRLAPEFSSLAMAGTGRFAQTVAVAGRAGERWAIACLHFDAYDAMARGAQAREVVGWAERRDERAVVLAGDFNLDVHHPTRRAEDHVTFQILMNALDDLGARAGATALLGRRVDYVMARRGVSGRVEVLRGRRVRFGDHDPLVANLTFVDGPEGLP